MTKARIFFFIMLSFAGGIAGRSFIEIPYTVLFPIFIIGFLVILAGLLRKKKQFWATGLMILAVLVGIVRYDYYDYSQPVLRELYGKSFTFEGYVFREPSRSDKALNFSFRVESLEGTVLDRPFLVRVTTRRYPEYEIGDVLVVRGVIKEPENLNGFDYAAYLKKDGIFAVVSFPVIEEKGGRKGNPIVLFLSSVKHAFEEKIAAALPEPHGALAKGLILGERESIPDDLKQAFNRAGVTHIVALSGYNITIVGSFFLSFLIFLTIPFYRAFWIATSGIILFVILTGASPSVTRAGIMGILVLIARREGRIYQMKNALAFAGALMLFHNPYVLRFDAAFELSFLATVGLMVISPRIEERIVERFHRLRARIRGAEEFHREGSNIIFRTFAETIGAQAAVLPLLIVLFGRVSLISPISNVAIVLAVPYAMAASFITGVLGFFSAALSNISAFVSWAILEYMIRMIEFFAKFPYASVEIPPGVAPFIAFGSALAVLFYFFTRFYGTDRTTR